MTTNQDAFAEAFATKLRTLLPTLKVYVVDVTDAVPPFPYCVLYPLGITQLGGSLNRDAEDGNFNLQISSVGETTRQTDTASDRIFQAIFAQNAGGYVNDFGNNWRMILSLGATARSGANTFRRDDTYLFRKEL